MKLVCKNDIVISYFPDSVEVDLSVFGEDFYIIKYSGELDNLDRLGDEPPQGTNDVRLYVAPSRPPLDLKAYTAEVRYKKEVGGISTPEGLVIQTDRESQALVNGAFSLCIAEPNTVINFKTPGGFVQIDAATMQIIAVAVGRHVQACFNKEAEVNGDIDALEITTTEQIDAAFADL